MERAGFLPTDIYYRFNEDDYKWVALTNWTFTTDFQLPTAFLSPGKSIFLDCHGLDTVSDIVLNGQLVGKSDNMFRRYKLDITHEAQEVNSLSIAFQSPIAYAEEQFGKQSENYVVPPNCTFPQGDCHANHIRKMQSSFR